ncbi:MAG: hypothetical protein ABI620_08170, partial [Chloroflexota bacterium]
QSPNFHDPAHIGLLVMVIGLAATGVAHGIPVWAAAVGLIGLAMSLLSVRNEPIAAVWCLSLLAVGLDARLPRGADVRSARQSRHRRFLEIGLAVVSVAAVTIVVLPRVQPTDAAIQSAGLPDRAVTYLGEAAPGARVFVEYGWAGYVIERLADDGARVFIDGRNDMYPDAILEDYTSIRRADAGWEDRLDAYAVDAILVPPTAALVPAAAATGRWCAAVDEASQVLLMRCVAGG